MKKSGSIEFSLGEELNKLQKRLDNIAPSLEAQLNESLADVAETTYASIISNAQRNLDSTKLDYISGVKFEDLGDNSYAIYLEGKWPQMLEDGFPSYVMQETLLKSQSNVSSGSRAGSPWVQTAKDGHKFAHVPIGGKSSPPGGSSMADVVKSLKAKNMANRKQKITSIFKDTNGNPVQGKAATVREKGSPLDGLVKYQSTAKDASGKARTSSVYVLYRTISETGKPWVHPGFSGLGAFDEAEKQVIENISKILQDML